MTPVELGASSSNVSVNDSWGWTDPDTEIEYALVGREDGLAFVDLSDPLNPVLVANLPTNSTSAIWRDVKVYANHAFVVADGALQHGMQVFDLTRLRSIAAVPETVTADFVYTEIASVHNIVINEASGFAYAVGSNGGGTTCSGGLHMIDIRDPVNPTFAGCQIDASVGRGYTHDAQCVIYSGPDVEHQGKEICFNSNESGVNIADVSTKTLPVTLSFLTYPGSQYVHQGWLSEDHAYFYQNDELDELRNGTKTTTNIWDVSDLDDPILVKRFDHGTDNIDHNLYVKGDFLFEANYTSGLQIFDIADRENPILHGFFDTWPASNAAGFDGAWSVYPFFESQSIVISSSNGLFVVKQETAVPGDTDESESSDPANNALALVAVFPNPSSGNSTVNISVTVPKDQQVAVKVIDMVGREVAMLYDGPMVANEVVSLPWTDSSLPSGHYLVTITTADGMVSRNMVKLR